MVPDVRPFPPSAAMVEPVLGAVPVVPTGTDQTLMVDPMSLGSDEPHPLADQFITDLMAMRAPKVLELGTRRWSDDLVTHHRAWAPDDAQYVMGDVENGTDVDLYADAHDLSPWFEDDDTDAFIAVAVWEHLRFSWVAAQEAFRILRPGGIAYIQSHMAFMRHGYPNDYTRWTSDGLSALFEWAGFTTVGVSMTHRVHLTPLTPVARWNEGAASEAWLCVDGYFRKPGA